MHHETHSFQLKYCPNIQELCILWYTHQFCKLYTRI